MKGRREKGGEAEDCLRPSRRATGGLRPKTKARRGLPGTGLEQVRLGKHSDNFDVEIKNQEHNNPLQEIHLTPYEINALKQHDVNNLSKLLEANPGDLSKVYPEPDTTKSRLARKQKD